MKARILFPEISMIYNRQSVEIKSDSIQIKIDIFRAQLIEWLRLRL